MASHVEVITTDLRRAKVQVYPGTTLSQVLDKACQILRLSGDDYMLKHKTKQVDLLLPFRASGLGSGAKLELVKRSSSPSVVSVALQFSSPEPSVPSGRLTDKFPSNLTLWKVLRQFESGSAGEGRNLNITGRGIAQTSAGLQSGRGQLYYEMPALNVMGREFASFTDLQKTLAQVGITSGSVLLRLSYRKSDQTLYDAMTDIRRYFDETEKDEARPREAAVPEASNNAMLANEDSYAPAQASEAPTAPLDAAASPSAQEPHAVDDTDAMEVTPTTSKDQLQPVSVFSAPTSSTPAAASAEIVESDYMPSITHAQLHQSRLLANTQNKRLKSDRELAADAAAAAAKIAAIKSVKVRVRFPDNTSAQWNFGTDATGATLFAAVRSVSANPDQPFKLVLPGGQGAVVDSEDEMYKLIKGYGLKGGVLFSLHWEDSASAAARTQPFLMQRFASQAQEVKVPDLPEELPTDEVASPPPAKAEKTEKPADGTAKKLPKWLKLPGKK